MATSTSKTKIMKTKWEKNHPFKKPIGNCVIKSIYPSLKTRYPLSQLTDHKRSERFILREESPIQGTGSWAELPRVLAWVFLLLTFQSLERNQDDNFFRSWLKRVSRIRHISRERLPWGTPQSVDNQSEKLNLPSLRNHLNFYFSLKGCILSLYYVSFCFSWAVAYQIFHWLYH